MRNGGNGESLANKTEGKGSDGESDIIEERYFDDLPFSTTTNGVRGGETFIAEGVEETFENSGEGHPIHNISQRHPSETP